MSYLDFINEKPRNVFYKWLVTRFFFSKNTCLTVGWLGMLVFGVVLSTSGIPTLYF